jgi:hypothetical protein
MSQTVRVQLFYGSREIRYGPEGVDLSFFKTVERSYESGRKTMGVITNLMYKAFRKDEEQWKLLVMPLHNKPRWLPGVEVNMGVVLIYGRSKIQSSRGNFQSCTRGTSVPCTKLEATHLTNMCCGQHVHTVSVA